MANERETSQSDAHASNKDSAPEKLVYESNPKHSEPWQAGRKGSLCEAEVRPLASDLLRKSVEWEGKRYALNQGRAYCAQEHLPGRWHGYPVGWVEVPAKLVRQLIQSGVLTKHDRKKYWESH